MRKFATLSSAVLLAASSAAFAGFSGNQFSKIGDFVQTGPSTTTAGLFRFFGDCNFDAATDQTALQGLRPDLTTFDFTSSGSNAKFTDGGFGTAAALDGRYGSGVYKYTVTAGAIAGATLLIDCPTPQYPTSVPAFSPATFNALGSLVPGVDFTVNYNSFNPDANANFGLVTFIVRDASGSEVFNGTNFNSFSPFTIPGAAILENQDYTFDLRFYNVKLYRSSPTELESAINHQFITTAAAHSVPEPGYLSLGLASLALATRRRR